MTHTVSPQRPDVADHAAPDDVVVERTPIDAAAVAQYSATMLPGVLYLLGVYVFDGVVPAPLHGLVGVAVTAGCTLLVRLARRSG